MATKAEVEACAGCKMLEYANFPASAASERMPALITSWVQRYGMPLYVTSVGDNDFDFAVPALRGGGVDPADVKLIGADGNRSAYQRIRAGGEYQVVTISEPFEQQAYQAIDEFNRAFHQQQWSGFVQQPFLVTGDERQRRRRREGHVLPRQRLQGALSQDLGRARQVTPGTVPEAWLASAAASVMFRRRRRPAAVPRLRAP